ncbi:MAG: hypothetical protein IIA14_10210 [SAR324 cluster bacterium]|nr:hypothetical protein [SAR324 cluster bacterium]
MRGPAAPSRGVPALVAFRRGKHAFDRGLSEFEAAEKIDFGPYAEWNAPARLYFNVARAYREFRGEPHDAPWDIQKIFASIYKLAQARGIDTVF